MATASYSRPLALWIVEAQGRVRARVDARAFNREIDRSTSFLCMSAFIASTERGKTFLSAGLRYSSSRSIPVKPCRPRLARRWRHRPPREAPGLVEERKIVTRPA